MARTFLLRSILAMLLPHYPTLFLPTVTLLYYSCRRSNGYNDFLYDIHINLLGSEWGAYVAGIVGLLATILCVTGIVLWSGWRKLATGFKIKWNATTKRLNYDLHKVVGIIVFGNVVICGNKQQHCLPDELAVGAAISCFLESVASFLRAGNTL